MAKLPPINRIVKEDFQDEPWAEKLLWPINRFMESVSSALNKNLTLQDNLQGQVKQLNFTTQAVVADTFPLFFTPTTPNRATDLWITSLRRVDNLVITDAATADWGIASDGQISINYISGLVASTSYIVRFSLLSEET